MAPSRAIRASYWQKYYVHRRLRPEAYGGLIYNNLVNKTDYPINSEVLNSAALAQTHSTFGTYLLPHAYPEAAPLHSSYTGGAASIAGVQATLLKAFFDENFVIPNPVVPDPNDPTKVIPYSGEQLTVGGELNKLATNYAIGRSLGGIHWRSDVEQQKQAKQELYNHLQFIESEGLSKLSENGPYWFGKSVSLVDLTFYPWFERWAVIEEYRGFKLPSEFIRIQRWWDAVSQRESVKAIANSKELYLERYARFIHTPVSVN